VEAGRELLRYDSLRDTYLPEMERLHGVVASMEKDLEGHRSEAEDLATDLAGHAETVKALREESEAGRRDAETERAAFEAERAEVQEVLAHKDERIGALTADLEGHRLKLGELEGLRALELGELEVRGARLDEVNRELTAQNEIVRRAHEQLEATVQRIEEFVDQEARARGAVRLADDCAETLSNRLERAKGRELSLEEEIEIIIGARDLRLAERNQAREEAAQAAAALSEARATIEQLEGDLAEAEGERKMLREESQRLWNRLGRSALLRWLTGARKLG
jgi:chromosome segregation ATPase